MRASTLRDRLSPPASAPFVIAPKGTATSVALVGFRVTPAMQRVIPAETSVVLMYTSVRRSNWVPWSSLFLRLIHRVAGAREQGSVLHCPAEPAAKIDCTSAAVRARLKI